MKGINWKRFYEKEAKLVKFLPEEDPAEEVRVKLALSLIPKNVGSVLDVGCGDGYLCSVLKEKVGMVSGMDISETRIKRAKKGFKGIDFRTGDVTALPYKNDFFDLVIAVEVLEHIRNFKKSVKEMRRVSRKFVAFTVPYKEEPKKVICPHCLKKFYLSGHINYFDENIIKELAKENSLKILKVKKMSPFPYLKFRSYPRFVKDFLSQLVAMKIGGYIGVLFEVRER